MKKWLMAVLLATILVLGACGGSDETPDENDGTNDDVNTEEPADNEGTDDEADEGADAGDASYDVAAAEEAYQQSCSSCHAADLTGGVGPDLNAVGASLSADEIEDIIQNGVGSMPAVSLDDDDRAAVAQWLADKK